jgi:predicted transcriptional regulator
MKSTKKSSRAKRGRMPRTTVSFPAEIQAQLERLAKQKKVSVAWIVRDAVERYILSETPLFKAIDEQEA